MTTFSYQARDASGKIVSGIQDALNEDNAVTSLMSRGLMVLSLQQKAAVSRSRKKTWTVKETDLVLFTRQLSTMIEAGISLVQAMTALYDQYSTYGATPMGPRLQTPLLSQSVHEPMLAIRCRAPRKSMKYHRVILSGRRMTAKLRRIYSPPRWKPTPAHMLWTRFHWRRTVC